MKRWSPVLAPVLLILLTSVALASGGEGGHHADSGALLQDFIYRIIDFTLVAGVVIYFVRKPFKNGLANRSKNIEAALAEAKRIKDEAEAKFAEYDRKLAKADQEVQGLAKAIKEEALLERDRILAEANALSARIREEAGRTAEQEIARARDLLQQEAAATALKLAEELLVKNLSKDDQARLIDDYVQKVGEVH
jgi:F-type H+-transporting ATPase subunit b